ncbi:hypothetical protein K439DRAFT_770079 [Ramaria rubella]|nr:hypothetical protein K439DRAFT_770079 [Ramaria rubella]
MRKCLVKHEFPREPEAAEEARAFVCLESHAVNRDSPVPRVSSIKLMRLVLAQV